jgi:hypothetical protein
MGIATGMRLTTRPSLRLLRALLLLISAHVLLPPPSAYSQAPQKGPLLRPSPLDCGTGGDPGADSMQIVGLFNFVKAVCCDQLGEDCYSGGMLPDSCAEPGCAHAVDLVESSCRPGGGPTGGAWLDPFLGTAFGPILDPLIAKCGVCNPRGCAEQRAETEKEYSITSQRDDESPLMIDELPSGSLPIFIIDGADVADDDATNCETCNLNLLGLHECNDRCTSVTPVAASSVGESCRSSHDCAAGAFCTRDFQGGASSVCAACSDCAPAPSSQTRRDTMSIRAPVGQEIRATIEALYLPAHSRLTVVPSAAALKAAGLNVTWQGQSLPPADSPSGSSSRVVVSSGGVLVIELYADKKDARLPQTFRISINPACTPAAGACSGHGSCVSGVCECECRPPAADGDPQCYDGEACQWAPER